MEITYLPFPLQGFGQVFLLVAPVMEPGTQEVSTALTERLKKGEPSLTCAQLIFPQSLLRLRHPICYNPPKFYRACSVAA
jgi:hypothetical protein